MGSPFFPQFLQGRAEDAFDALGTILRRAQMGAHGAVGGLGLPELEPMPGQEPIQSPSVVAAPPTTHSLSLRTPRADAARPVQQDSDPARSVPSMARGDEPEFAGLRGMDFRARPGAPQMAEFDEELGMMLPPGMRPRGGEGRGQGAGVTFPDADRTLFSSGAGDISTILGDIQRAELFGARNRAEAGETLSEVADERARQVMQDLIDPTRMQIEGESRTAALERLLPGRVVGTGEGGRPIYGAPLSRLSVDEDPQGPTAARVSEREMAPRFGELLAAGARRQDPRQAAEASLFSGRANLASELQAFETAIQQQLAQGQITRQAAEAALQNARTRAAVLADIMSGRALSPAFFGLNAAPLTQVPEENGR